jgi:hypothetical protein
MVLNIPNPNSSEPGRQWWWWWPAESGSSWPQEQVSMQDEAALAQDKSNANGSYKQSWFHLVNEQLSKLSHFFPTTFYECMVSAWTVYWSSFLASCDLISLSRTDSIFWQETLNDNISCCWSTVTLSFMLYIASIQAVSIIIIIYNKIIFHNGVCYVTKFRGACTIKIFTCTSLKRHKINFLH